MQIFLIIIFILATFASFWLFLCKYKFSPLWLMLSAWFISIAISQLRLSTLELVWPGKFWWLIFVSLVSFAVGVYCFSRFPSPDAEASTSPKGRGETRSSLLPSGEGGRRPEEGRLRIVIYGLFLISLGALYLFYKKAGNFPLLAPDPDAFRFAADDKVPGLINYAAQLARVFIPLSFFLMFYPASTRGEDKLNNESTRGGEKFNWKKHLDLILLCLAGAGFIVLFASRTQIFFIDLWVMGLYLLMRKPNWKQALKFYPFFVLVSIVVLAAVPLIRQTKSYGQDYLAVVTGIDTSHYNKVEKAFVPIYVGVSFNMQALLHAENYYQTHELQYGKVSLDPFTNIFGKIIKPLNKLKSYFDLGAIFYPWWNTGTYLFPFVQDFGTAAFYFVPFIIGGILTLVWRYWQTRPNFLSINLYAYAMFFMVMTIYLSFTVRAEMYLDLMLLFIIYIFIGKIHDRN